MVELLTALITSMPPLLLVALGAVVVLGLQGWVIYLLVRQARGQEEIATNHLHDLPDMVEALRRIENLLTVMNVNLIYIRARINGRDLGE